MQTLLIAVQWTHEEEAAVMLVEATAPMVVGGQDTSPGQCL
jgi:hypothetical protein